MGAPCLPRRSIDGLRPRSFFSRRGISLLEVLISMFVLLFGLLGVASLIVAGRHELGAADRFDQAASVGRAAFRDLKIRGYLDPSTWHTLDEQGNDTPIWQPDHVNHPGRPFLIKGVRVDRFAAVIDPLGLAAPSGTFSRSFPANTSSGLYLLRLSPYSLSDPATAYALADLVFRSSHDLSIVPNAVSSDLPPTQQMLAGVRRASLGNFTWMATLKTDPTMPALDTLVTISVAVLYKRDLGNPSAAEGRTTSVAILGSETFELTLPLHPVTSRPWAVKPDRWIMLSGSLGTGNHFQWYRVLAAGQVDGNKQLVTLAGPDWNPQMTGTTAYLIDNVIAVYEKHMRLDLPADAY